MSPVRRTVPGCKTFKLDTAKIRRLAPTLKRVEGLAEVFAILPDETRTKILFALSQEEPCVCDLAGLLAIRVRGMVGEERDLRPVRRPGG